MKMRNGPYWTLCYLLNTQKVLVLIPLSIDCGTMKVVATLYPTEKRKETKVMGRYFNKLS
jgi:hypothetical protein